MTLCRDHVVANAGSGNQDESQDPVERVTTRNNSERGSTACRKRGDQESTMDHTNDPLERVSERVVRRSTLLVTCCSEHVGKNAEGVPWTPMVPSNL